VNCTAVRNKRQSAQLVGPIGRADPTGRRQACRRMKDILASAGAKPPRERSSASPTAPGAPPRGRRARAKRVQRWAGSSRRFNSRSAPRVAKKRANGARVFLAAASRAWRAARGERALPNAHGARTPACRTWPAALRAGGAPGGAAVMSMRIECWLAVLRYSFTKSLAPPDSRPLRRRRRLPKEKREIQLGGSKMGDGVYTAQILGFSSVKRKLRLGRRD